MQNDTLIEAIKLPGGWFVVPKGALGTVGFYPVPWELTKIRYARSESDAIERAFRPGQCVG